MRARRALKRLYGEDFSADPEEAEFQAPKLRHRSAEAASLGPSSSMAEPVICLE